MPEADKKKIAKIMEKHGVIVGYLFGSAARGQMGPHSDIDTAVLFDHRLSDTEQFNKKIAISNEIAKECGSKDADVINLATATDPLIKYIAIVSGILILSKDEQARFAIERKVVRGYEDTRELRRIARVITRMQLFDGSFGLALKTI